MKEELPSIASTTKQDYSNQQQELAQKVASMVNGRFANMVQSGMLAPIASPLVSIGVNCVTDRLAEMTGLSMKRYLEAQGVAAGDEVPDYNGPEIKELDDEQESQQYLGIGVAAGSESSENGKILREKAKAALEWMREHPGETLDIAMNVVTLIPGFGNVVGGIYKGIRFIQYGARAVKAGRSVHKAYQVYDAKTGNIFPIIHLKIN